MRCDFKITSVCEFLSETAVSGLYVVTTQRLHARCSSRTMPDSPPMLKVHVRCLRNAAAGVLIVTKQRRGCVAPNSFPRVFFKRPAAFNDQVRSETQRVPVLQRRESKTKNQQYMARNARTHQLGVLRPHSVAGRSRHYQELACVCKPHALLPAPERLRRIFFDASGRIRDGDEAAPGCITLGGGENAEDFDAGRLQIHAKFVTCHEVPVIFTVNCRGCGVL